MSSTVFTDYITIIPSSWLNDVNASVYNALGNGVAAPLTRAQLLTNLGLNIVCTTSNRPNPPAYLNQQVLDITLGLPIWASQISPPIWIDSAGVSV